MSSTASDLVKLIVFYRLGDKYYFQWVTPNSKRGFKVEGDPIVPEILKNGEVIVLRTLQKKERRNFTIIGVYNESPDISIAQIKFSNGEEMDAYLPKGFGCVEVLNGNVSITEGKFLGKNGRIITGM